MTPREHVLAILEHRNSGAPAYWTGNPHPDTFELYLNQLGLPDPEALYVHFGDDVRWIPADSGYKHPEGKPVFDFYGGRKRENLNMPGVFADCESVEEVERYSWPDLANLDFSDIITEIDRHQERAVWTGMWAPFFHDIAEFFGMDNYFVGMFERPEVVDAVTDRVVGYYERANELFFDQLGDRADTYFFGNDFGTQRALILSPHLFKRFVLPSINRLIATAKKRGKKVILHSCGSITPLIPTLIEAGIDGLHPLQAAATDMGAERLVSEFAGHLAFIGGVDTQVLLVRANPDEIYSEVMRLRETFGPNYVVSPSHEALLPNVPLANVEAMAKAARA